jgi:DNA-binding transcriptional ArsR family regulator
LTRRVVAKAAQIDDSFRALADPTRRAMVERLSRGPVAVSELAAPLAMSLAAVVQHVQILEDSGVIRTEKIGRVRTCRLEPRGLEGAERWIAKHRALWERRLDRLGEFLARQDASRRPTKKKVTGVTTGKARQ